MPPPDKKQTTDVLVMGPAVPRSPQECGSKRNLLLGLPAELRLKVLEYLPVQDIWACLQVSSGWRSLVLDPHAVRALSKRLFPSLRENVARKSKPKRGAPRAVDAAAAEASEFVEEARLRVSSGMLFQDARSQGWMLDEPDALPVKFPAHMPEGFDYELFSELFGKDDAYENSLGQPVYPRDALYAHGRLAWRRCDLDDQCLFVDDMHAGVRRAFVPPVSYHECTPVALGNTFVVAVTESRPERPMGLVAWNVSEPDLPAESITLEHAEHYRGTKVGTAGSQVVALSYILKEDPLPDEAVAHYEATVWKVGTEPKTFTIPFDGSLELSRYEEVDDQMDLTQEPIVHPDKDGVFFVCYIHLEGEKGGTVFVEEITEGRSTGRWSHRVETDILSMANQLIYAEPSKWRRVDSHGTYALALADTDRQISDWCKEFESVNFNIHTRGFSTQRHCLPVEGDAIADSREPALHFWNDKATLSASYAGYAGQEDFDDFDAPVFTMQWPREDDDHRRGQRMEAVPIYQAPRNMAPEAEVAGWQGLCRTTDGGADAPGEDSYSTHWGFEEFLGHPSSRGSSRRGGRVLGQLKYALMVDRQELHFRRQLLGDELPIPDAIYGDDDFLVLVSECGYTAWRAG